VFLRTIWLHNFRKYQDQTIEFPEGIVGIVGPNGAGKSTVLEAIGWTLYGNCMSRTSKEGVRRTGAGPAEDCEVQLDFDFGDHQYRVLRARRGRSQAGQAFAYQDGSSIPAAQREEGVTQFVQRLLGMDHSTFENTIYTQQKELAALSSMEPAERQRFIRRILNIERIDMAIKSIRADKRESDKFIEGIQESLKDLDVLTGEEQEVAKQEKAAHRILLHLQKQMELTKKKLAAAKKEKAVEETKYKAWNGLAKLRATNESQCQSWEERLKQAQTDKNDLEEKKKELKRLQPQVKEYQGLEKRKVEAEQVRLVFQQKTNLEKAAVELQADLRQRQKANDAVVKELKPYAGDTRKLAKLETQRERAEAETEKIQQTERTLYGQLTTWETERTKLLRQRSEVEDLGPDSVCPTCFRKLGATHERILDHLNSEIAERDRRLQESRTQQKQLQEQRTSLQKMLQQWRLDEQALQLRLKQKAKLEQTAKSQCEELDKRTRELEKTQAALKKLGEVHFDPTAYEELCQNLHVLKPKQEKYLKLAGEVERLPLVVESIQAYRESLAQTRTTGQEIQQQIRELAFDQAVYDTVLAAFEEKTEEWSQSQLVCKETEKDLALSQQERKQIQETIQEQLTLRKKMRDSAIRSQDLLGLETLMDTFKGELTARMRPLIATRASQLLNEITEGRYPLVELSENYDISILDGDRNFPLKRFSGGEEDLANLCLRIALSQVIAEQSGAEINFIALDEIFGSQDAHRQAAILNALTRLSSQFRQIFLITHVSEVEEMLPMALSVEENLSTHISQAVWE
jgi:exonuclease SbcC